MNISRVIIVIEASEEQVQQEVVILLSYNGILIEVYIIGTGLFLYMY